MLGNALHSFRPSRTTNMLSNIGIIQIFQCQKADVVEPVDTQDLKS